MKNRVIALLLAGIIFLTLTACQQSANDTIVDSTDYSEIYKMIKALSDEQWAEREKWSARAVKERNGAVEVLEDSVDFDADDEAAPTVQEVNEYSGNNDLASSTEEGIAGGMGGSEDYSDTNNQVEGVQESDIVKTDGTNIYIASGSQYNYETNEEIPGKVSVVKADNGSMEIIEQLMLENATPVEMLLYGEKLIIIWSKTEYIEYGTLSSRIEPYYEGGWYGDTAVSETIVQVYDTKGFISPSNDPNFTPLFSTYSQKGYFSSSRMIDNNIYLVTNFYPNIPQKFAESDIDCYIPSYTTNNERQYVHAGAIKLPENLDEIHYTVIGGLDVNLSDLSVSVTANLGSVYIVYSSLDNFYITRSSYEETQEKETTDTIISWGWSAAESFTIIDKFSISAGNVEFKATAKVRGDARNQFNFDEHNGVLRVVTEIYGKAPDSTKSTASGTFTILPATPGTGWWEFNENDETNAWGLQGGTLYTLDENLNILAEIHRIGYGENVKSVRFMGDTGYVVTFWQTDPLYSFDLSNPSNPIQLDELKIPGFSTYMHQWNNGLLLGMGVDTDNSGRRSGLKMTMFDTSDLEALAERHVVTLQGDGEWAWISSPIEYEHKAALVSPNKNIIGFPYSDYSYNPSYNSNGVTIYAVYSYDYSQGFTLIGEIVHNLGIYDYNGFQRGMFIGDYIYAITDSVIVSASLGENSLKEIQKLNLNDFEKDVEQ